MLGLGLDIRKDHGSGLSGSGSDLSHLIFETEFINATTLVNNDEDITITIVSTDSYTINQLIDPATFVDITGGQVNGTFSVTLQRCTEAADGTVTVVAESGPATLYGYGYVYNLPPYEFLTVVLLPTNGYSPTLLGPYFDVLLGNTAGVDATSFGGQDITTNVEADYRIKFTYTVGSQTSAEFTTGLYPIAALT